LPFTISVYGVSHGRRLSGGRLFAECSPGAFDGLRIDEFGNVWTSGGKGVHCYRPDGIWLGSIKVAGEQAGD
jgi:gluconolactonase